MKTTVRAFHPDHLTPVQKISELNTAAFSRPQWLETPLTTPLDLEIGCGVGWHPIQYAEENPQRHLIAIEHTRAKFATFNRRLERHPDLQNLWAVHADAIRWVTQWIPPESLDRVLFMYPNPEPKAANKRWLRMPFFHRVMEILKPGGEVWLATNDASYFSEASDYAREEWGLTIALSREMRLGFPPRTHFEKKYLLRGETCHEAHWRKP